MTNVNASCCATLREQDPKELPPQGGDPKTAVADNSLPINADESTTKPVRSSCCCH